MSQRKVGKVPANFSIKECTEESLKKLFVRDLRAIIQSENLIIAHSARKAPYIQKILKHRDEMCEQQTTSIQKFDFEPANVLIAASKQNDNELKKLSVRMTTLNQKRSTLEQLKRSIPKSIENALNLCLSEIRAYQFRKHSLHKIIQKISKQQQQIIKNEKLKSLQHILDRMILRKEEVKKKYECSINELKNKHNKLENALVQVASDLNDMDLNRMEDIKSKMKELGPQKESILNSMKQTQISIDCIKTIMNETTNNQCIAIDITEWIKLESNKNNDNFNKAKYKKAIKTKSVSSTSQKKKKKFKRPIRAAKASKAQKMSICDVLPKTICPIKLCPVLNNGIYHESEHSMFESNISSERKQWIKDYNALHLMISQSKDIFLKQISIKSLNATIDSSHSVNDKKRRLEEDNFTIIDAKKQKLAQGADECINDSEFDEENEENNDDKANVDVVLSSYQTPNVTQLSSRQSKQSLNINGKYNAFKPMNQKRHRVRTENKQETKVDIDSTHPLLVNDALLKAQQLNDNNCLHWMAKGICGYKESGKCRFNHPEKFDAMNFLCPALNRGGQECQRMDCAYNHDRKTLPCKAYYNSTCEQQICSYSHNFTKDEFCDRQQTKIKRCDAYKQWMQNKNERKNNSNNWHLSNEQQMNQDLTLTSNDQPFTSVLTE